MKERLKILSVFAISFIFLFTSCIPTTENPQPDPPQPLTEEEELQQMLLSLAVGGAIGLLAGLIILEIFPPPNSTSTSAPIVVPPQTTQTTTTNSSNSQTQTTSNNQTTQPSSESVEAEAEISALLDSLTATTDTSSQQVQTAQPSVSATQTAQAANSSNNQSEQTNSNNTVTQPVQTSRADSTTNTLQGNIGQANGLISAIDSITCSNGDFDNLRTILPIYNNIPDLKDALNSAFAGDFQTMYAAGKAQGLQTSNLLQQGRDAKGQFEQNRDSSIQALNEWLTVDPVAWIAEIDAGTADAFIFGDASQGPLGQDANWSRSYLIAQYSLARVNMIIACYEEVE